MINTHQKKTMSKVRKRLTSEQEVVATAAMYLDYAYHWSTHKENNELGDLFDKLAMAVGKVNLSELVGEHPRTDLRFPFLAFIVTQTPETLKISQKEYDFLLNFVKENQ